MAPWQAASPPPSGAKSDWRRWLKQQLPGAEEARGQSAELVRHLAGFLPATPGLKLASFSPLPGEPDLRPLPELRPDLLWHLPRVAGDQLEFLPFTATTRFRAGPFGIPEPAGNPVPLGEIEIFLCPGLGFATDGTRLGRGKGFYDRALAGARPDALRIGIAFPIQFVSRLPADPHDLPMTHLAAPGGILQLTPTPAPAARTPESSP